MLGWALWAVAMLGLAAVLASLAILVVLAGMAAGAPSVIIWAAGVSFAVLPLAIGAAVARYRLTVAALFRPARRRVQHTVDRRFDRRRYDAARTIDGFSARLRQQVDLDSLTAELLAVVDHTMQSTKISLWLRTPDGGRNDAGTLVGYNPVGGST